MTTPNVFTERYPLAMLGHGSLTPAACGALAVAIEDAISRVEGWGLQVRSAVRLRRAIAHLKRVAERGSYGSTRESRQTTANAIHLANDIYVITRALPRDPNPDVVNEFKAILKGTLDADSRDRRAYETQSQLWFGAALAHSNLHPGILAYEGTRPDYLVTVDQIRMTVEVKRPGTMTAAERLIEDAAEQIDAAGLPGFIVLDISDIVACASASQTAQPATDDTATYYEHVRPIFYRFADQLFDYVERYVTNRPAEVTCRVIGLVTFSRHSTWNGTDVVTHDFGFFLRGQQIETLTALLYRHPADRMFELLDHGFASITGNRARPATFKSQLR